MTIESGIITVEYKLEKKESRRTERLFPSKISCRFIRYIRSNKSDKFGIKFWLYDKWYIINGFSYLGKNERRYSFGEFVVLKLMESFEIWKKRNG